MMNVEKRLTELCGMPLNEADDSRLYLALLKLVQDQAERLVSKAARCHFTEDFLREVSHAETAKKSSASMFVH